jgi:hypothetical protein
VLYEREGVGANLGSAFKPVYMELCNPKSRWKRLLSFPWIMSMTSSPMPSPTPKPPEKQK